MFCVFVPSLLSHARWMYQHMCGFFLHSHPQFVHRINSSWTLLANIRVRSFVQVHSHKHITEGPEVAGQFRPTKHLALFQFHRLFQQHYKLSININIKFMYTMSFEDFLFSFSAHYRQIITHDNKSFFFSCWTQVCLSVTSESVCLTVCT